MKIKGFFYEGEKGYLLAIRKGLTIHIESAILALDELPKTVGAEKRKDKTPTEERVVMKLFMYVFRSLQTGFLLYQKLRCDFIKQKTPCDAQSFSVSRKAL